MAARTRRIVERPGHEGWDVWWTATEKGRYVTAGEALAAIKARDAADVATDPKGLVVTTIEWEPRTNLGRAVANVWAGK